MKIGLSEQLLETLHYQKNPAWVTNPFYPEEIAVLNYTVLNYTVLNYTVLNYTVSNYTVSNYTVARACF